MIKKVKVAVFLTLGLLILGLFFYFLLTSPILKVNKTPITLSKPETSLFPLEELKKIKVPEKGEKINGNIGVPQEVFLFSSANESNIRIFELKGMNNELSPKEFRVYQNDLIHIKISALDKDYDFFLEGYHLSTKIKKDETKIIEFQALNPGKFKFYCSLCSSKNNPQGEIIIVPR